MSVIRSTRTMIAAGALGLGLLAAPAIASAAPASSHTAGVHTTVTATTTPTTPTTTPKTSKAPVTRTYTVIAGTFRTQAQADKRLAAITAKGINGLSVVQIGKTPRSTRFRVEETGMTRANAKALWKQLHKAHFFAFFTAR